MSYDLSMRSVASTMDIVFDRWWLHYIVNFSKEKKKEANRTITYGVHHLGSLEGAKT
jgi:hypothetical protein